jgi:hypothetical protein
MTNAKKRKLKRQNAISKMPLPKKNCTKQITGGTAQLVPLEERDTFEPIRDPVNRLLSRLRP